MSSGIASPTPPSSGWQSRRLAEIETYIDARVEETRRHVRAVDLTVALLRLAIGVLVYLLAAMVLDQWILTDGLGNRGRFLLWAVLVLMAGWYGARYVVPLLIHRISPIFAAQTIERTRPSLKNGLINFLLLRRTPEAIESDELSRRVYQGLQVHTASELSRLTVGTTVDRLHLIRLGYLLAALVAVCCIYFVVSPKNPLVSFGRVIFPWARIGVPTRVSIDAVIPGDTTAYQGDTLVVSAEIHGLRDGEPANLYYSSVDGHSVDQSVPMSVQEGGYRHQGELPPGRLGLQHSLFYWIAAGDAVSRVFRLDVQIPPAIVVDRVEYDYPAYTGLPQCVAVREGDLRAIEGTRVTIHGAANYPVAQALIELEGDSRPTVPMTPNGSTAVGRLTLAMSRADPSQPEYRWYQLRFTDPERRENRRPIRHRIDVIPDQKPEVRFAEPLPDEMQVPVNGSVEFQVYAEDPDFGLRRLEWRGERDKRGLLIPPLLKKPRPEKPHQGPFQAVFVFEPAKLGLKPGERVTYWAEAADCKEKADDPGFVGNVSETEKRTIVIVAEAPKTDPGQTRGNKDSHRSPKPGEQDRPEQRNDEAAQADENQRPMPNASDAPQNGRDQQPNDHSSRRQSRDRNNPATPESPSEKPPEKPSEDLGDQSQNGQAGPSQPNSGGKSGKKAGKTDNNQKSGQSADSSDSDQSGDSSNTLSAQQGKGTDASGQQGAQPSKPIDGDTNPGEAFERILEDRQKQQAKSESAAPRKQPGAESPTSDQEPSDDQASGEKARSGGHPNQETKSGAQPNESGNQRPRTGTKPMEQKSSGETPRDENSAAREERNAPDPARTSARSEEKSPTSAMQQRGKGQPDDSAAPDAKTPPDGPKAKQTSESAAKRPSDSPTGGEPTETSPEDRNMPNAKNGQGEKSSQAEKSSQGEKSNQGEKAGKAKRSGQSDESGSDEKPGMSQNSGKGENDALANRKMSQSGQKSGEKDPVRDATTADAEKGESEKAETRKGDAGKADKDEAEKDDASANPSEQGRRGADQSSRPEASRSNAAKGQEKGQKISPPSPQETNQPRGKNDDQGSRGGRKDDASGENAPPSPSISPKTSDTKSESQGDRSADGKTGGGQQAKQSGEGAPGSQMPTDRGREGSQEPGEGEIGNKSGGQTKSDQAAGKSSATAESKSAGSSRQSIGQKDEKSASPNDSPGKDGDPAQKAPPQTDSSSIAKSGQQGGSTGMNPTGGGGEPGTAGDQVPLPDAPAPPPDEPNLEYARKQTTLALEHLADQLAKDRSELLERLGWDRDYAENFLRQWEQMLRAADQPGPQGDAAKRELEQALKSLGLRPTESRVRKATTPTDKLQQLQDTGRIPPPLEWRDYFKAYTEGVGRSME